MKIVVEKPILNAHAVLGEGPVWHAGDAVLYWVDIVSECIHRFDPVRGIDKTIFVGKTVGSVAVREGGGLIAALEDGFYLVWDEGVSPLCLPEGILPGQRFNDGKCDPAGRFWAGTMVLGQDGPKGALYSLDGSGICRRMLEGIRCSNGLAWTDDCKTMYYIDTLTYRIDAFKYDLRTGDICQRRCVVDFTSHEANTQGSPRAGIPDGMTIDEEGMLWVAEWMGDKVSRWNPITGKKIGEVCLPVSKVTSCTFGGPELSTLYITTAAEGLSQDELYRQPYAGGIFSVQIPVKGRTAALFAG